MLWPSAVWGGRLVGVPCVIQAFVGGEPTAVTQGIVRRGLCDTTLGS
jgi:hypothetical protein